MYRNCITRQQVGRGKYTITVTQPYNEINYNFDTQEEADEFWESGEWYGTAIKEY